METFLKWKQTKFRWKFCINTKLWIKICMNGLGIFSQILLRCFLKNWTNWGKTLYITNNHSNVWTWWEERGKILNFPTRLLWESPKSILFFFVGSWKTNNDYQSLKDDHFGNNTEIFHIYLFKRFLKRNLHFSPNL